MLNLTKSINKYDSKDIRMIWEEPEIYGELLEREIWLIYGTKGSGKTTLVDYLKRYSSSEGRISEIFYEDEELIKRLNMNKIIKGDIQKPESLFFRPIWRNVNLLRESLEQSKIEPNDINKVINIWKQSNRKVITIRPREADIFNSIYNFIRKNIDDSEINNKIVTESIISFLDFVIHTKLINDIVPMRSSLTTGYEKVCYDFLVNNSLYKGSILRMALRFVNRISNGFKLLENLSGILDELPAPVFDEAKDAFFRYVKTQPLNIILCIDDIDEAGFDNSLYDKIFINSLLILCLRLNTKYIDENVPIRFVLTAPNELFFQKELWNTDKMNIHSIHLQWSNPLKMKRLVSKRIRVELKTKKRNIKKERYLYSIDPSDIWNQIFPDHIYNKGGEEECSFEYIIRHTFYTPRNILVIVDKILRRLLQLGYTLANMKEDEINIYTLSEIFCSSVEDYSIEIVDSFHMIHKTFYENLINCLDEFTSRPNIWTRNCLREFISIHLVGCLRKNKKELNINDIIDELFRIGFLGFGTPENVESNQDSEIYDLSFSYLGKYPKPRKWDIAVISPIFYDYYKIRSSYIDKPVVPHNELALDIKTISKLGNYNIKTNE
jgi:energy-coupling factor transporter ATP-binding protein EcfA2